MSSGGVDIRMTGDERDLIKAQAKVLKSQEEVIGKYKKMLSEARNSSRKSGRELERFARRATRINRTPMEKYGESIRKARRALDAGLISQRTYNREVDRAKRQMKEAERGQRNTFGTRAQRRIATWAAGFAASVFTIQRVVQVLQKANQEVERMAQRQRSAEGGIADLAQMADTIPEFQELLSKARKTFRAGGTETLDEAGRLVFKLESAGALSERELFTQLGATKLVSDPAEFARAAATLRKSIGKDETGSFRNIVSKAFGASTFSPSTADALLTAAAKGGTGARQLGVSDEELLAATAMMATQRGTAAEGGTSIAALLKSLDRAGGFEGQSLAKSIEQVQQRVAAGEDVRSILGGRQEAVVAFRGLSRNMDELRTATEAVAKAERTDAVTAKLELSRSAPMLVAAQARRRGRAALETARTGDAIRRNLADAVFEEIAARREQKGAFEFVTGLARGGLGLGRMLAAENTDRFLLETALQRPESAAGVAARRVLGDDAEAQLRAALNATAERMESAASNLDQAAENFQTGTTRANRANAMQGAGLEGG